MNNSSNITNKNSQSFRESLRASYPVCSSLIDKGLWEKFINSCDQDMDNDVFHETLMLRKGEFGFPDFLPELARLELAAGKTALAEIPNECAKTMVNPTLQLLKLSWKNLLHFMNNGDNHSDIVPEPGEELAVIWKEPKTRVVRTQVAMDEILLVLKMIVEGIDPEDAARLGNLPVGAVDSAIDRAVREGILLAPQSRIRRGQEFLHGEKTHDEKFLVSKAFTLQWHVTQACDLHCKHCYDRSDRSQMDFRQALRILDDLRNFCRGRNVKGRISFSGGNPLLYPQFEELYRAASERGFVISILGNPSPKKQIEELLAIQNPIFFQVSLEGLPEHNDMIRGKGHFERTLAFLKMLRELGVSSMVMLTLTRDNINQILPLARILEDFTDSFHFNRLSMVGEGAQLRLPSHEDYQRFLETYMTAAEQSPVMGLKDNLINIIHEQKNMKMFGGCTGFGCGAAFNFLALLPDGEMHACRKFPSKIGNIFEQGLEDIYDSALARRYRSGCKECASCKIRPVCGGCLASAYSHGFDIFEKKDPYCFIEK